MRETLSRLKARLAELEAAGSREDGKRFGLGCLDVDDALGGGLVQGGLHEVLAGTEADAGAACGFVAALAFRASTREHGVTWVRQDFTATQTGLLYTPGLCELGLDPERLVLVRPRDGTGVLRAGLDALRCRGLGVVVLEIWGTPRTLDLTATRRLALAAEGSGVTCLMLRIASEPQSVASLTRWRVAARPSRPLAANAPGMSSFDVTLLRQRAGQAGKSWRLEWDHEHRLFRKTPPLSRPVAAVPAGRPAAEPAGPVARTG